MRQDDGRGFSSLDFGHSEGVCGFVRILAGLVEWRMGFGTSNKNLHSLRVQLHDTIP
jgi:hypothetical protein